MTMPHRFIDVSECPLPIVAFPVHRSSPLCLPWRHSCHPTFRYSTPTRLCEAALMRTVLQAGAGPRAQVQVRRQAQLECRDGVWPERRGVVEVIATVLYGQMANRAESASQLVLHWYVAIGDQFRR